MPNNLPYEIHIIVSHKRGEPCIELRRAIIDLDIMKQVLSCAFANRPIIMLPTFTDKMRGIASLVDKGILFKEGEDYKFTF